MSKRILVLVTLSVTMGGCQFFDNDSSTPFVAALPGLRGFLPADGSDIQPGARLYPGPGAEEGLGGARTTALNAAYHEARLAAAGADTVLTLNRRPAAAASEIVATFGPSAPGGGNLADISVFDTADVTVGGAPFGAGRALLYDGTPSTVLEHMSFGYWAIVDTGSDTILTAAGGAIGTPATDLAPGAALGTATYRGRTVGGIVDVATAGNFRVLSADIVLTADFAASRMDADITGTRLSDPLSGADVGPGPVFHFEDASLVSFGPPTAAGFQGTTDDGTFNATMDGAPLTPAGGAFADLAGIFYGGALNEVGGGWYVVTPTDEVSGTFGAAR
ncbi:hypothetical protein L2U69_14415 [Zavarzinia compransoris]|uniref:hypothetical protein n=1 Tax=Zavarzinia marina TaxID=2911065 RepID=UPI001F4148C8|nr:hypothetical protein [Zavarzinia marina]MCF4166843.1 hypothetical protein [Zavarzinia marina]